MSRRGRVIGGRVVASRAGRRRWRIAFAAGLVAAVVGCTPAVADEQPSILKTYGLDWIERVREEAWPQPKEQRPIICLLDTGVAITPDTPADNPAGPIVARLAIDGGNGEPQGTESGHAHGTKMASVIAAPRNDWGTVGVFPQARILSVRVTEGNEVHITPAFMREGVRRCLDWVSEVGTRVAAVVMAESNYDQRTTDRAAWIVAGSMVRDQAGLMVAAAGNQAGAEVVAPPLGVDEVVAVGAGNAARGRCAFTPVTPVPTVWAPGCDAVGWPAGTSTATAVVGALIAAGVTRATGLTAADLLAEVLTAGGIVDGSGLRAARFGSLVTDPVPAGTGSNLVTDTQILVERTGDTERVLRLWRPRATAKWRARKVRVRVAGGVPPTGRVVVRIGTSKTVGRAGSKLVVVKRARRPTRAEVWVEGAQPAPWRSLLLKIPVAKS